MTSRESHLVGVVEAVIHESRDERRLPDCKAERRERFSCKVSLWPGSSKDAHSLERLAYKNRRKGRSRPQEKKTPTLGAELSSRGTQLSDTTHQAVTEEAYPLSSSYHPSPGLPRPQAPSDMRSQQPSLLTAACARLDIPPDSSSAQGRLSLVPIYST